jgi:hypothetical protein
MSASLREALIPLRMTLIRITFTKEHDAGKSARATQFKLKADA